MTAFLRTYRYLRLAEKYDSSKTVAVEMRSLTICGGGGKSVRNDRNGDTSQVNGKKARSNLPVCVN